MNAPNVSFLTPERATRLWEVAARRQLDVSVLCENLHDPHNISAIMRTAEGFGIPIIDVIGKGSEFSGHPKTSSSAKEWIQIRNHETVREAVDQVRSEGKKLVVTALQKDAQSIFETDFTQPCAIVMGNEHAGASEEIIALADEIIYIPMVGMVQSLNVSVATAVVLTELFRQRKMAGMYDNEMDEEKRKTYEQWVAREAEKRTISE